MGLVLALIGCVLLAEIGKAADEDSAAVTVDKQARTVSIPCRIAPRKLEKYPDIYPIEVIACWANHGRERRMKLC